MTAFLQTQLQANRLRPQEGTCTGNTPVQPYRARMYEAVLKNTSGPHEGLKLPPFTSSIANDSHTLVKSRSKIRV